MTQQVSSLPSLTHLWTILTFALIKEGRTALDMKARGLQLSMPPDEAPRQRIIKARPNLERRVRGGSRAMKSLYLVAY